MIVGLSKCKTRIVIELGNKESDDFGRSLLYIINGHAPKIKDDIYTLSQVEQLHDLFREMCVAYKELTNS